MSEFLRKLPAGFSPGDGVLRNDHFQMAYVTNDIARATQIFKDRYGIREFAEMTAQKMPSGGEISIALAWAGGIMFELVQAHGPGTEFYNDRLPAQGFAIRHHHLGYFISDDAAWEALEQEIARGGWKVAFKADAPGFIRARYIDAPELGHYLEYLMPEGAGIDFFKSVPVS